MTNDATPPTDQPDTSLTNVDLGLLANVRVSMTVEVGNTQITLQDLLRLNEGSVVELDRMAGDPLDILVNGTPIAKGEVVVVGEKFGIRFGDIVDPRQRIETV
ncbi:Flagellar motor switch protein FliN [Roseovarius sp. EC-HK134]|jgi:flagellar motor switch protein FliN/FliY|uniref:Flagellar motor switch protein FliN n=1 Tax=Roseovarius mucosus TaxID=215743 RepID=A0A1V0RM62_9RHOB|nr:MULTISPECIES: flagellar motor switch protein FliN [Roseovarius]ARE82786.1 flagellar motor switch protein FliN [Roseovarius mucosus]AWZ18956.1 Flagellar motor switch protein FliN [Roseovarius sp. AK1035]EDM33130.1 Flagellar motor switch FliN protein [Roseovarius sp. TM1035]MBW4973500.1 flagellar motor switch protein FliN [Roseovarius mucosus]VVT01929.1 Flagellar motor switch protein FliN [Roseovarius sp. EC-HK134]|tara:strand:+ start:1765 stop:2073 length:309 start_codon:yes stop_codon:yes gene_type:complete